MPEDIVESFNIKRLTILNEKGEVDDSLMPSLSHNDIKKMYELLILSRTFDRYALNLHAEGRLGTYASILGQEASQVGSAFAIWIFPSFREMGVYITVGYPLHMLFQYWSGDERGMRTPDNLNIFPLCIPFDEETILNSVKKTGRVVIVHEAPKTSGFGAEISATIAEDAMLYLKSPIVRVTGYDVVMPLPKLEDYYMPSVERIRKGIEDILKY